MAKTRCRVIFERWGTLAAYAVAGAGAYLLLDRFLLGEFLAILREEWPLRLSAAGLLVIALARIGIDVHPRLARVVWFLPPVWFAGILGAVGLILWGPLIGLNYQIAYPIPKAVLLLAIPVIWGAWGHLLPRFPGRRAPQKQRTPTSAGKDARSIEELDESQLIAWLNNDDEIESPEQDRFGAATVARRIAELLRSASVPSIAIVGEAGSGKSSLAELVHRCLCDTDSGVLFVRVSLWPFETSEAAVRGVLSELVRKVSERAPTLSVRSLPQSYLRSVEGSGKIGAIVGPHLSSQSPEQVVQEIDQVLRAAGIRAVVCVEDLERFSGLSVDGGPDRDSAEERLAPVRAMLYQLDRSESISVLISDATLRARFDLLKIARYVEQPPQPEPQVVLEIILKSRECCRGIQDDLIEPLPDDKRQYLPRTEGMLSYWLFSSNDESIPFPDCLVPLMQTPRALKDALRRFVDRWKSLKGEVDIDHLLAVCVLQVCAPDAFEFVDARVHRFRRETPRESSDQLGERTGPTPQEAFNDFLNNYEASRSRAIRGLVEFLFPTFAGFRTFPADHSQGVSDVWLNDYWSRIKSQPGISESESDQWILRKISRWQGGFHGSLVDVAVDPRFSPRLRQFRNILKPDDVCRLLEEVAAHHACQDASEWADLTAEGITTLWHLCVDKRLPGERLRNTLMRIIEQHGAEHFPLMLSIGRRFVGDDPQYNPFGNPEDPGLVIQAMREAVTSSVSSPDRFRCAFRNGSHHTLSQVVRRVCNGPNDDLWWAMRAAIVRLAGADPLLAQSQTILLLVRHDLERVRIETEEGPDRHVTEVAYALDDAFQLIPPSDLCAIFQDANFDELVARCQGLESAIGVVRGLVEQAHREHQLEHDAEDIWDGRDDQCH